MDWNLFGSVAIAVFLIRWDQNKIRVHSLGKDLIILGLFIFLLSPFLERANITFSLFSHVPAKMEEWISAAILASFVLCLFYKSWRSLHPGSCNQKEQKP